MSRYTVFLNGRLIPEDQAQLSIWDRGFTLGDAVFDAFRTFGLRAFGLDDHLARLARSLRYVRIELSMAEAQLRSAILSTLDANKHLVAEDDDLVVTIRISRGVPGNQAPTVLITARPVLFSRFADLYAKGVELSTPTVRAVPPEVIDPRVKTQSRMANVLAELQADDARPGSWPLLCNSRGIITESARANFLMVLDEVVMAPKGGRVLEGVTAAYTARLADGLGYAVVERDLTPYDVMLADEAFLTSTSMCILPVQSLNGVGINGGQVPGPITAQLMDGWRELTGVDFVSQALKYKDRPTG